MLTGTLFYSILITAVVCRHIDTKKNLFTVNKSEILEIANNADKEYFDGVVHYKWNEKNLIWNSAESIENDFRKLIAMKGVKFMYKRDMFWRTWRQIQDINGVNKIVNYRCNHQIIENSAACDHCGLWSIETPLCPYELYSVIDKDSMCGHYYLEPKSYTHHCPSIIKFSDLSSTCDNPIKTSWRFIRDFSAPKVNTTVLCKGKDYCEFSTSYLITPHAIIFRIIDTNNTVIYSRLMKDNNKNYGCVYDCGQYDPNMKKILNPDNPTKMSLTIPHRKNKRDLPNLPIKLSMVKLRKIKKYLPVSKNCGKEQSFDKLQKPYFPSTSVSEDYSEYLLNVILQSKATTESFCNKIQKKTELYDEYENDSYSKT